MAFPSVRSQIATNGTTASANAVVNLPATVAAGDTLLVIIRNAAAGGFSFPGGGGWTELFDASADAATGFMAAAWKKAVGTEGGTTITVTQTSSKFCAVAYSIAGAADPTVFPPQSSTVAVGTTGEPNATTVTPTGGAKDYLWLTCYGMEGEQTGITAYPASFTVAQLFANSGTAGAVTTNCTIGAAVRANLNAASLDAAAWDVAGTLDDSSAYTIAFHPDPNIPIGPPAVGALSVTGRVAALALAAGLSVGALGVTGQTPAVNIGLPGPVISPASATLRLKGPERPYPKFIPPTGALTFAGESPQFFLSGGPGGMFLTGRTPSLQFRQAIPAGSLALVGPLPGLGLPRLVSVPVGNLSLAGQSLQVTLVASPVPAGAMAIIGQTLVIARGIPLQPADLACAGEDVDLVVSSDTAISIPKASLVFKGPQHSGHYVPDTRVLTLTGFVPTVSLSSGGQQITIAVPAGGLVLTGRVPTVIRLGFIPVPVGSLTVVGQFVGQAFGQIQPASLVLTGQTPVRLLSNQTNIQVPVRALTLTGQTPVGVVSGSVLISSPKGTLTLAGHVPSVSSGSGTSIVIGTGVLVFKGPQRITVTTISVPVGVLTLTGQFARQAFQGANTGILTLTGQIPSVTSGALSQVPAGSLSLTGLAPSFSRGVSIPSGTLTLISQLPLVQVGAGTLIPAGSLSLTGRIPSLQSALPIPQRAFTLTGQAPSLSVGAVAQPDAGTLALTGQPSAIHHTLPVATRALILTGTLPSLQIGAGTLMPAGSLTLTGQAPSLASRLFVVQQALTLTGQTPLLVVGVVGQPAAGTLDLAGQTPRLLFSSQIAAGPLTFTGRQPSIQVGAGTLMPVGGLTFTGQAFTASVAERLAVPIGTLTLSGQIPVASLGIGLAIPAGTLTESGLAPSLAQAFQGGAPASLTLSGIAPSVQIGAGTLLPAGTISLTGQTPALSFTYQISTRVLTLTGQVPIVTAAQPPFVFAVPAGTLTVTGQPIGAGAILAVPRGTLVLVGQATGLDRSVEPGTRALTLTGTLPTLQFAHRITPDPAALTLTGPLVDSVRSDEDITTVSMTGTYQDNVNMSGTYQTNVDVTGILG